MAPRYHFMLTDFRGDKLSSGDAHTLVGVKRIFKKMNAKNCHVYKRRINGNCPSDPFITLHK